MSAGARFGIGLRSKRDSPSCGRQTSTASERHEIQLRSHVLLRSADREFLKKSRNAHDAFQRGPCLERLAGLWAGKLNPNLPFDRMAEACAAGYRATMAVADKLMPFSLYPEAYPGYRAARRNRVTNHHRASTFVRFDDKTNVADNIAQARSVFSRQPTSCSTGSRFRRRGSSRTRGHRGEAGGLAVPRRSVERLDQDKDVTRTRDR